jgi:hemolysin activation/secretion protein
MRTHLTGSVQLKTAIANCAWLCRGLVILLSSLSTLDAQTPPPVVVAQENPVFYIQEYRVKGATKISSLEVEEAVYPYLGPGRTADDVEQARLALEKSFHDKGYQTVSVLIPQQDPRYGVISLEVVEGTVGRLTVNNSKWFLPSKIRAASPSMAEGGVPNMNDVQREILALNRLADRRVTPELKPGSTPGTFDIDLNVEDKFPLHGSVELNNRYSPNTSELRLNAAISYSNLFQLGHTLGFNGQVAPLNSDDALVYSGYYLARVSDNLSLLFSATRQDSDVSTLGGGSVLGRGDILSLRALFDMPSGEGFFQSFSVGIDRKDFTEDLNVGAAVISAPIEYYPISANYGATWLHGKTAFTEANASLTYGLRGVGSDQSAYNLKRFGSNGSFVVLKTDVSHTRDLKNGSQLFGKIQAQLSDKPLINTEQFSGGGLATARGYLEGTALGDNAIFATAEYRTPSILGQADATDQENTKADEWRFHAFIDAGALSIYDPLPGQDRNTYLLSSGIGTRLRYREIFNSSLDLAVPLNAVPPVKQGDIRVTFRGWMDF